MSEQNLYFNILTFDFPSEKQVFYFSKEDIAKSQKIHKSIFPKEIDSLFPGISSNCADFIYTTFSGEQEGFMPLTIDFKTENQDFIKRYYNRQINFYFRKVKEQIVKVGFIKENQVWVHSPKLSTSQWDVYMKFSLKVQIATVSKYPELLVSYDGTSKVLKQPVSELIQEVSPTAFNWVLKDRKLDKFEQISEGDIPDYSQYYPVLNRKLQTALGIPTEAPARGNKYPDYLTNIDTFYKKFLNTAEFKEIIPIHKEGFLNVSSARINKTNEDGVPLPSSASIAPARCSIWL